MFLKGLHCIHFVFKGAALYSFQIRMGIGNYLITSAVTVLTILFMNYPPPELSGRLKDWYKKGAFHKFNEFSVFYIGKAK